jgi:ABC-type transport system involved in multi-copper enzyme maturation permease subunit
VLLFNLLIGPVFSAGSVTSERERQTLDLLLTTTLTPMQIFWGKLLSGLRVSSVLTAFLLWPVVLAFITPMIPDFRENFLTVIAWLIIVALTCLTTANLGLFCSSCFRKTSTSQIVTYAVLVLLYFAPPAIRFFTSEYFPASSVQPISWWLSTLSPFVAVHEFPLYVEDFEIGYSRWSAARTDGVTGLFGWPWGDLRHFGVYLGLTLLINLGLCLGMVRMFQRRWRVSAASD